MRQLFFTVFIVFGVTFNLLAQSNEPILKVLPDTVRMGEIQLSDLSEESGKVQIEVYNEGKRPLILNEVTGCCGTNIKEKPNAPILPGKKGTIKVEFRIEPRPQVISRTVTIKSNASNLKVVKVPIVGLVIQDKQANEIVL